MRASKANLECADVILSRNGLPPHAWPDLRRDIALTIDIAERELRKKLKRGGGEREVIVVDEARTTCEACRDRSIERGVDNYFRRHGLDRKYESERQRP